MSDYGWSLVSVVTAPAPTPGSSGPAASAAVAPAGAARLSGYRPHLDGVRTVAVYLVVVFHAGADRLAGGFIGVDVFFVLSGYLITGILLTEADRTGGIALGRFYGRRARRLLPASIAVLLAVMAMGSWLFDAVQRDALPVEPYLAYWRHRQAMQQEQVIAVATLAAGTAHELGTPLATNVPRVRVVRATMFFSMICPNTGILMMN